VQTKGERYNAAGEDGESSATSYRSRGARAGGVSSCLLAVSPTERGVRGVATCYQASASPEACGSGGLLQERLFPFHAIIIP